MGSTHHSNRHSRPLLSNSDSTSATACTTASSTTASRPSRPTATSASSSGTLLTTRGLRGVRYVDGALDGPVLGCLPAGNGSFGTSVSAGPRGRVDGLYVIRSASSMRPRTDTYANVGLIGCMADGGRYDGSGRSSTDSIGESRVLRPACASASASGKRSAGDDLRWANF